VDALPEHFVGTHHRLVELVNFMCEQMLASFRESGMSVPPWRQSTSILSKWFLPTARGGSLPGTPGRAAGSPGRSPAGSPGRSPVTKGTVSFNPTQVLREAGAGVGAGAFNPFKALTEAGTAGARAPGRPPVAKGTASFNPFKALTEAGAAGAEKENTSSMAMEYSSTPAGSTGSGLKSTTARPQLSPRSPMDVSPGFAKTGFSPGGGATQHSHNVNRTGLARVL
jgi:hypothetical protein